MMSPITCPQIQAHEVIASPTALPQDHVQPSNPPAARLAHTRSCASVTHLYCFTAHHAMTKQVLTPVGCVQAGACTDESPQQWESTTTKAGAQRVQLCSSPSQMPGGGGQAQPQAACQQRKPYIQPQTHPLPFYLSKFAVLYIDDAILHWSLHGPSTAPAASTGPWGLGCWQHRNVTDSAKATAWGRLPSL